MKKLLITSIVLIVAGLGLVLLSDPVISSAGGNTPSATQISSSPPPGGNSTSGLSNSCTTLSNGGHQGFCTTTNTHERSGIAIITGIGIALCALGLILTGVVTFSKIGALDKVTIS